MESQTGTSNPSDSFDVYPVLCVIGELGRSCDECSKKLPDTFYLTNRGHIFCHGCAEVDGEDRKVCAKFLCHKDMHTGLIYKVVIRKHDGEKTSSSVEEYLEKWRKEIPLRKYISSADTYIKENEKNLQRAINELRDRKIAYMAGYSELLRGIFPTELEREIYEKRTRAMVENHESRLASNLTRECLNINHNLIVMKIHAENMLASFERLEKFTVSLGKLKGSWETRDAELEIMSEIFSTVKEAFENREDETIKKTGASFIPLVIIDRHAGDARRMFSDHYFTVDEKSIIQYLGDLDAGRVSEFRDFEIGEETDDSGENTTHSKKRKLSDD